MSGCPIDRAVCTLRCRRASRWVTATRSDPVVGSQSTWAAPQHSIARSRTHDRVARCDLDGLGENASRKLGDLRPGSAVVGGCDEEHGVDAFEKRDSMATAACGLRGSTARSIRRALAGASIARARCVVHVQPPSRLVDRPLVDATIVLRWR